jgi:hypothetical protein
MSEVALARLWQLPDGRHCLLFRNVHADTWEIRIIEAKAVVRAAVFRDAIEAMDEAKRWRAAFESEGVDTEA